MSRADQDQTTQSQLLEELLKSAGVDIRVGIPGRVAKVESINPPTVTVAPGVQRNGADAADCEVQGVRMQGLSSGGATIAMPVSVNDPVYLLIADRDIDGWLAANGARTVEATDPRTHDLADCFAIPMDPGELPSGAAGNLWIGYAGSYLKMVSGGTHTIEGTVIKLGASAPFLEYAMRGTTFNTEHAIMLGFIDAALAALAVDTNLDPATKTACGAVAVKIAAFLDASDTWTSAKVKVE